MRFTFVTYSRFSYGIEIQVKFPFSLPLQSHLLGDLTEVPVPVRFIYFLLGPEDSDLDYHEVGRAMATLMSDKVRHTVCGCGCGCVHACIHACVRASVRVNYSPLYISSIFTRWHTLH